MREKIERQQMQIREAVVAPDTKINDLSAALSTALAHGRDNEIREPKAVADETTLQLIARLEAQLAGETARRTAIEKRLQAVQDREAEAKAGQRSAERLAQALTMELEQAEAALHHEKPQQDVSHSHLAGKTVLYVGGMTRHAVELQGITQRFSAKLLHHDGGIENQVSQIAGLISHSAMQLVKRLSRQAGISHIPMRSSGLASFVAALHTAPKI